jgi:hypothetical protein
MVRYIQGEEGEKGIGHLSPYNVRETLFYSQFPLLLSSFLTISSSFPLTISSLFSFLSCGLSSVGSDFDCVM